MSCTTILVGKKASYDGSTLMARNDDSGAGHFTEKKLTVVLPEEQPRHYKSVISKVEVDLPDNPQRYTAIPNAVDGEGIWAAAGINESNVAMTATETITSNLYLQDALNWSESPFPLPYEESEAVLSGAAKDSRNLYCLRV